MPKNKPSVIDLFSGPGGLSLGFSKAGFTTVLANDISIDALSTLKYNHPDAEIAHKPIADLSSKEIEKVLKAKGYNELDGIIGGPPCRGFSTANRKTRFLDNPGNHLFREYLRIVYDFKPKFFVLENVIGILSMGQGAIVNAILEEMHKIGYDVKTQVLLAADYGVPQLRKRVIFIGNRIGSNNLHPQKKLNSHEYVTVQDAISDLPPMRGLGFDETLYVSPPLNEYQELMRAKSDKIYNHTITKSNDLIIERYKHIPQGGNWKHIPTKLMGNYKSCEHMHSNIYKRLDYNKASITISNFRKMMLIHPTEHRGLSVREAARIQSFPDHYRFIGKIGSLQQQIADAVPPLMAEAIARSIKKKLYFQKGEEKYKTKGQTKTTKSTVIESFPNLSL